jgi:hypothetical protein
VYILAWKTVEHLRREMLSLLSKDIPKTPAPFPSCVLDPSAYQMNTTRGAYSAGYWNFYCTCFWLKLCCLTLFGVLLTGDTTIEFSNVNDKLFSMNVYVQQEE